MWLVVGSTVVTLVCVHVMVEEFTQTARARSWGDNGCSAHSDVSWKNGAHRAHGHSWLTRAVGFAAVSDMSYVLRSPWSACLRHNTRGDSFDSTLARLSNTPPAY